MSDSIVTVKVLSMTAWTDTLFSFTTTRPQSFKFSAGQFVRLGLVPAKLKFYQQNSKASQVLAEHSPSGLYGSDGMDGLSESGSVDTNEEIFRAYSLVSSPFAEELEFFSVVIEGGAFTSRLQHLQVGDELLLNSTPFGFLTLARYQAPAPKDLWLLATGTGVAPFLSMLQDLKTWQDYEDIVLAYSVRTQAELAYAERIEAIAEQFAQLVDNPARFHFVPIVTREVVAGALNARLPKLLLDGSLVKRVGVAMTAEHSHVMLCGNPQMVEDTKETLKQLGLSMNRRGQGNIAVENYW